MADHLRLLFEQVGSGGERQLGNAPYKVPVQTFLAGKGKDSKAVQVSLNLVVEVSKSWLSWGSNFGAGVAQRNPRGALMDN